MFQPASPPSSCLWHGNAVHKARIERGVRIAFLELFREPEQVAGVFDLIVSVVRLRCGLIMLLIRGNAVFIISERLHLNVAAVTPASLIISYKLFPAVEDGGSGISCISAEIRLGVGGIARIRVGRRGIQLHRAAVDLEIARGKAVLAP